MSVLRSARRPPPGSSPCSTRRAVESSWRDPRRPYGGETRLQGRRGSDVLCDPEEHARKRGRRWSERERRVRRRRRSPGRRSPRLPVPSAGRAELRRSRARRLRRYPLQSPRSPGPSNRREPWTCSALGRRPATRNADPARPARSRRATASLVAEGAGLYPTCGFFGAVLGREKSRIKNVARDTGTTLWQRGHGGVIRRPAAASRYEASGRQGGDGPTHPGGIEVLAAAARAHELPNTTPAP